MSITAGILLLTVFPFAQTPEVFVYRDNPDQNYRWTDYYQSNRFVIRYSENQTHDAYITRATADRALAELEHAYDVLVHEMGFHPAHTSATPAASRFKCEVIVTRGRNNSSGTSAWADGGGTAYGGTVGSGNSRAPIMWMPSGLHRNTMTHELVHGLQQMSGGFQSDNPQGNNLVGWVHESHANFMTNQVYNSIDGATEVNTRQAHLHLGYSHTRYNNWLFLEYFLDTKGMRFINDIWSNAYKSSGGGYTNDQRNADPFSETMRVHNISQAEFGDMIGGYAMTNVIYDYDRKAQFRRVYNASSVIERHRRHRFTYLEALDSTDGANGRFVVPFAFAPQRYAYNIIRLYPDGSGTVRVRFRGDVQTKNNVPNYARVHDNEPTVNHVHDNPGSDWRYGLVAVTGDAANDNAAVTARYSELMRTDNGIGRDLSMTMQSGETQLYLVVAAAPSVNHKIKWDQYYYTIYRFPYMVEITGAKPEGFQALDTAGMTRHSNGGGWVERPANVDATAYVGRNARVTGGAQVRNSARIEGRAVVRGGTVNSSAIVRDYALIVGGTVTGSAVVSDGAVVWEGQVSENARIHGSSFIYGGSTRVSGNAQVGGTSWLSGGILSGTAQMLGDGRGDMTASEGVYFAVGNGSSSDPRGSSRTAAPAEFTAPRSMAWYGDDQTPIAGKTPVVAKNTNSTFRFDNKGVLQYKLVGVPAANLKIFDGRGRVIKTMTLSSSQNSVNTSINTASQMLLWKVDVNGKVIDQGRVSIKR